VNTDPALARALAGDLLNRVEGLVLDAEAETRPLELEPYRGQLFELFARAVEAGLVDDEAVVDLTADGLLRALSERWQLAETARQSVAGGSPLPADQMGRMRLMWSVMRMWMEWTYAWERWPEFH
jgi:pimeloyl-ACP methyl ester carboxylesterase